MSIVIIMAIGATIIDIMEMAKRICESVYRKLCHNRTYKVKEKLIYWN